jgi:hypothetical protein
VRGNREEAGEGDREKDNDEKEVSQSRLKARCAAAAKVEVASGSPRQRCQAIRHSSKERIPSNSNLPFFSANVPASLTPLAAKSSALNYSFSRPYYRMAFFVHLISGTLLTLQTSSQLHAGFSCIVAAATKE